MAELDGAYAELDRLCIGVAVELGVSRETAWEGLCMQYMLLHRVYALKAGDSALSIRDGVRGMVEALIVSQGIDCQPWQVVASDEVK
jgi:hypothetical protein